VEVFGGRTTEQHLVLEPLPPDETPGTDAPPEDPDEEQDCSPPFDILWSSDELVVRLVDPGVVEVLPGDRITAVDGAESDDPTMMDLALYGPPGPLGIEVTRPDGTRARVMTTRARCE